MNKRVFRTGFALTGIVMSVGAYAQDVLWKVNGGSAVVTFDQSTIQNAGLQIVGLVPTEFGQYPQEGGIGFTIQRDSSFLASPSNGVLNYFPGGEVLVKGGFYIKSGKRTVPVFNLRVKSADLSLDAGLDIRGDASNPANVSMRANHVANYLDVNRRSLTMGWADLSISAEAAQALGRPELEDLQIGQFSVFATVEAQAPTSGWVFTQPPVQDATVDVNLWRMQSLTSMGRTGTYPNGTTGFAMSTTSCNSGTENIWWYSPMDQRHPVIVQNMYRIREGRLEQIGAAYLKHGFFATNTSDPEKGTGSHPGTGSLLGPNLTDTYGSGNNGDRYYLGPRSEVNPLTGEWTAFGSFFDVGTGGATPDGQRSLTSTQANALPSHKNRIEVLDSDLINQPAGTTFFYEALYHNPRQGTAPNYLYDSDMYNNVGNKRVTPSWNAGTTRFVFTEHDSGVKKQPRLMIQQYALNVGGQAVANVAEPRTEGDVWVACNPIDEGNGVWRYEISMYNFTSDRQVNKLTIPIMDGLTVTDIGFRDHDQVATNQWSGSYANGKIEWSSQGGANANPVTYGSNYNFFFRANIAPQSNMALLNLHKAPPVGSTLTTLLGATVAPPNGDRFADSYFIEWGSNGGGGLNDLHTSDNGYARVNTNLAQDTLYPIGVQITSISPVTNPGRIDLKVESKSDDPGRWQILQMWNYSTNDWVTIQSNVVGTSDVTNTATVTSGASNYVHPTTRVMKARLILDYGATENVEGVTYWIDQAFWKVSL